MRKFPFRVFPSNSRFVRGKTRALMAIEQRVLAPYSMRKPDPKGCEYELTIPYENDQDLDHTVYKILQEAA